MEDTPKKSKITLSKPEDIPQEQHEYTYDTPQYEPQQYEQSQYQSPQQTQTAYQEPNTARRLNPNVPNTYQQTNSPMPTNTPFQNSNYARGTATSTKYCKFCGEVIPFDAVVCTKCGRQVEQLQGNYYQQNNTFINTSVNVDNSPLSDKNRSTAGILCALGFFGVSGLHRFYTGHIAIGLIYLCTGGICGIGTLVDLINIIKGTFKDKQNRRLRD
jgi:hypothetical protein